MSHPLTIDDIIKKINDLEKENGQMKAEIIGLEETKINLSNDLTEVENQVRELESKVESLERDNMSLKDELEDATATEYEINTGLDKIEYNASNLLDVQVMEALADAYERSTPIKILTALQSCSN